MTVRNSKVRLSSMGKLTIETALAKACEKGLMEQHISQEFTDIADQLEQIE